MAVRPRYEIVFWYEQRTLPTVSQRRDGQPMGAYQRLNSTGKVRGTPARVGYALRAERDSLCRSTRHVVGGIQWKMMPREYPRWKSVYHYFRQWRRDGTWKRIHDTLRARVRRRLGRHKHPTAGCLDWQSVKGTHIKGVRGFDGGKLVKGRKRHLLVDTEGLLLQASVTAASESDPAGARPLLCA